MEAFTVPKRHVRGHGILSLAALLVLAASFVLPLFAPTKTSAIGSSVVTDLSNAARVQNGLPAFAYSSQLAAAAQAKAEHMKTNNYFEHTAPDGTTGWYFIGLTGYDYLTAGENLAASNEDASAVVNGWMNSPGHRANLLNPKFTEVGYGVVFIPQYLEYQNVYFIVALYGQPVTPSSPVVAAAPVAAPPETPVSPTPAAPVEPTPASVQQIEIAAPTTGIVVAPGQQPSGTVSGALTLASENQPISINPSVGNAIIGLGIILMIAGGLLELRHFARNPSFLHLHRHHTIQ